MKAAPAFVTLAAALRMSVLDLWYPVVPCVFSVFFGFVFCLLFFFTTVSIFMMMSVFLLVYLLGGIISRKTGRSSLPGVSLEHPPDALISHGHRSGFRHIGRLRDETNS